MAQGNPPGRRFLVAVGFPGYDDPRIGDLTLRVVDRLHLSPEVESSDLKEGLLLLGAKNELIALRAAPPARNP